MAQPEPHSAPTGFPPEKWAYFEGEASIARVSGDTRNLNPAYPAGARVICVGCGGGWEGESAGTSRFVGVDIDDDARRYRLARESPNEFCLASGEQLPFPDSAFTFYVARVSVMYMDLKRCLAEAHRVLAKNGQVWITCHDFPHVWHHMSGNLRALQLNAIVFRCYVLFNGLLYHIMGRLIRFPLNRARIESFQTRSGIRRGLERAGFRDVQFPEVQGAHFLVTARKPD